MNEIIELNSVEQMLFKRAAEKHLPVYGGFELTPYCNLACRMCYVKETVPGLPVLPAKTWLDFARQAADAGTLVVQVTGGEPMVHPEFRTIYKGLKKLGLVVTMNTNATQIDERMADFLAEDMPRRINVSLYGPSREVYQQLCGKGKAFDETVRALELMLERNIPVKINITPSTINFSYLDEMLSICKRYNLTTRITPYLFEPIRKTCAGKQGYRLSAEEMATAVEKVDRYQYNEKQMEALAMLARVGIESFETSTQTDALVPLRCRAATSSFWLCWDGKMNACVNMTAPRADVQELGFAGAWEKVKAYGGKIRVPARCGTCSLSRFCLNCAAISFHEYGTFERVPQIMCNAALEYARNLAKTDRFVGSGILKENEDENQKKS